MVIDHTCFIVGGLDAVRLGVGRLAMPIFFILAGHLVRRLTIRHAAIAALGVALPVAVPWVDNPNVLLWYALGAVVVVTSARVHRAAPALLALAAVTFTANFPWTVGTGFVPTLLLALMVAGHYMPRSWMIEAGRRLPRWMAVPGRFPVSFYVCHLLVLQSIVLLVGLDV